MHIAQNWRLNAQRYSLQGVKCEKCGKVMFPPREVCPQCQVEEAEQNSYSGSYAGVAHFNLNEVARTQSHEVELAAR